MKKPYDYKIKEIADRIWLIDEKFSTMFVIEGTDKALVIDCGVGAGDFKSVIESLTSKPYTLAVTHAHVDHIGGRGQFPDMYISKIDQSKIKSVNTPYRKLYMLSNIIAFGGGVDRKTIDVKKIQHEPTVHIIKEGDKFDLGGDRIIEVIETPGHTRGSLSFLLKSERIIFTGDVVNDFLFMWLSNATTIDELVPTVDKLIALPGFDIFWASHALESAARSHLDDIKSAVLALQKKRNMLLPFVLNFKHNGVAILYRATHIH